ncbi:MAG: sigma-70 family RNA polymerase sigma factor [Candidatus Methylacidiphilales bacterium]|nr:sigma-70 family RNA polymerase sigma factor [Candidatus Methylacidiphilales bacterium]
MTATMDKPHASWLQESFTAYESRLIHYAQQFVGDWETARDVAQDSFLKLCQQEPRKVGDPPGAWLYRVARNRALDILRARKRYPQDELDSVEDTLPHPGTETPDPRLAQVWETLGKLTPKQQEVVRLKFLHGLSYKEIRKVTGLSESNIGFIIHSAVRELRDRLQEPGARQ